MSGLVLRVGGRRRRRRRARAQEEAAESWNEAVRRARHTRACLEAVRESGPAVPERRRESASADPDRARVPVVVLAVVAGVLEPPV